MTQLLHPPKQVKLIVAMLSGDPILFDHAEHLMKNHWGPVDVQSNVMEFTFTDYYNKQMGSTLFRKLIAFAHLIDPGALAATKHITNTLEHACTDTLAARTLKVERPINLDSGYITQSKLILATTKDYSHRIYIGKSMYAEATLHYHQGRWQHWPYTYPDFASGDYDDFLSKTRNRLMEQLSSQKQDT